MIRPWMQSLMGGIAVLVATSFACDSQRDGFVDERGPGFADSGPDGPPSAPCENRVRCSRDLRSVVDACDESRIVESCPPEQGCAKSGCVPACEAVAHNSASVGCEFAAVPPARESEAFGSCFAAFVSNTWAAPARVEAEYAGAQLDLRVSARVVRTSRDNVSYEPFTGELQPGEAAVLFLSSDADAGSRDWVDCPEGVIPAVSKDTSIDGTARGSAFSIRASVPVSAYSVYPFGGAKSYIPSATLLLPRSAWKKSYIVMDAWERLELANHNPATQIISAEDDTEVTVVGSVPIQAGIDVEAAEKAVPHTYRLRRGEVLQFAQASRLMGSQVSANKDVAVMGGHECMFVPKADRWACDSSQVQLFPIHSWGSEYVAVPHRSRRATPEDYYYRIAAAIDGTVLTYEPARPAGAPAMLSASGSELFTTGDAFVVRSQDADHPISVYAYMTGSQFPPADGSDGDPEFTLVIPTEQYLDRYVFYVDASFRNSELIVVRSRAEGGAFEPVELDCGGALEGWVPVGAQGKYEYVRVRLTSNFDHQKVGSGTCGPGRHEIDSRGPFSVSVWGTDQYASYSYPGGAAIRTLNQVQPPIVR